MPKNAGALVREASELGWDVRAERRWTGRLWVRAVVLSGLVMVRAGVEETEHVCAWNESTGKFVTSASTGGFKAVRESVRAVRGVSREQEATGRTVWGRDAAEWVRQMDDAVAKVSAALGDARDAFNALDGSTPSGARAVELGSAAYAEARTAERSATDAVKAARAWLAEANGEDARGCASWRRAIVLAGQHIKEAGEAIAGAAARAEREALAAPIIEEAQERLVAQEAQWRKQPADAGREPSARGYAGLIVMFEDSSRAWCAWFDGHTDYDGVAHAGHGDPSLSFVAQYDAWAKSKRSSRSVYYPSRYTSAALIAGDRVDAAAVAFTLAVADRIEGRGAENLRKAAAAIRKNPRGFGTGNDRKHLADWAKYPHNSYGEPTRLAEHAVAEWAALETSQAAYNGVRDFENALHWDAHYAGERAEARAEADRAGLAGRDQARAERAASGRAAVAWEAAVERLTQARMRVHAAEVLAAGDVERAQACRDRVREGDALAEDVWSAVWRCEEAYDDVSRAKRDAGHYEESAETYRAARALSDFVAECERMEDAATRAESARAETLNLYACAFEDSATAVENRRRLQESTASDRSVPDEVTADLEPGDEVAVSSREVGGDDAAAAIEKKGAVPHSATEPLHPTRLLGYVQTARGSADLQRAEIVKTVGVIPIFSDEGISGTTAGADRPGLRELVAELQAADEVVVCRYDRLGRTPEALRAAIGLVNATGATLRSLTEPPAEELFPMMFTMAADVQEHRRSPVRRGIKPPPGRRAFQG
ncbi:recombinase family protein [Streptomyces griseoviridis]|uniref:recombinase family protein n=1 Tax=Streptomyces griseoviridis TaxID=45398 RepID=UPI0033F7A4E8